jgi:hypothetical protein
VGADYLVDAIIFNSSMPHKPLPNRTDSLRFSLDFRYQPTREAVAPDCLLPENPTHLRWEEIHRHRPDRMLSSTLGAVLT